ncbi:MAG: alkaline phosphatase D family protein [Bauldia sp.]
MALLRPYDRMIAGMSRRQLLNAAAMLGIGSLAAPLFSRSLLAKPVFRAYPFTLGVASGDPLPDGVVLWTRLAPDPLNGGGMPGQPVEVNWEVSATTSFANPLQKGTYLARPELNHSVHIEVSGLQPGRDYFYRFVCGDEVSQVGRTKTAPPVGAAVDAIKFGVVGCNHYESGFFTAYRRVAEQNYDFVIHTGDYIYEGRDNGNRTPDAVVRRHNGEEIFTLVDYRNRYALYKMDPDLMAAHASAPWLATRDDHEVENNYTLIDENEIPPEIFALRRAGAYQAYYENMPLRASALPEGSHQIVYRRLKFGNLLDINLLDTRQWRTDQPCGDGSRTNCAGIDDPKATMMGEAQEAWLLANLKDAKSRWTVLSQQVPMYMRDNIKAAPDGQFSMDKWDAYTVPRQRLFNQLRETRAPNPVMLSGDLHLAYASDLKMNFRDPKSETVGVEFTGTSVSSAGDGADVAANWATLKADNPHLKFHSARRGWLGVTATQSEMRGDFMVLDKVSERGLPAKRAASVAVAAGRPGLETA